MKFKQKAMVAALAGALVAPTMVLPTVAQAGFSGNVGVTSKYIFRGAEENENAAVQGGFDWESDMGLYAGYWGSSLSYGNADSDTGVENDVYFGYGGEVGKFGWDAGLLYYAYLNVDDADAPEIYGSFSFMDFSFGAAYMLDDVVWSNAGDIYLTASYETELPANLSFSAVLGYYLYDDSDPGEAGTIAANTTTNDSTFNTLTLSLSHPIGETGADASVGVVIGGKDRTDADIADQIILGVSYGFDI